MDSLQLFATAAPLGCLFALIGVGFQLVYATLGALNFAQGDFAMLGGFLAVTAVQVLQVPLGVTVLLTGAAMAIVGGLFSLGVYRPLRHRPHDSLIVGMIAASIIIENVALFAWGPSPYRLAGFFGGYVLRLGQVVLPAHAVAVICVTGLIIAALFFFLEHTLLGKMLRATAQDAETARTLGIPVDRVMVGTLALSAALAGIAGVLMVPMLSLSLRVGTDVLIKGFAAAVIGGVGNLRGVILGGLFVGILDAFIAFYVSSEYVNAIAFLLVILVLFLRPQGLLGAAVQERV